MGLRLLPLCPQNLISNLLVIQFFFEKLLWLVETILTDFSFVSSYHINYNKRKLYFFNADSLIQQKFMKILGCQSASLPASFLGLPLFLNSQFILFETAQLRGFKRSWWGGKGKCSIWLGNYNCLRPLSKTF